MGKDQQPGASEGTPSRDQVSDVLIVGQNGRGQGHLTTQVLEGLSEPFVCGRRKQRTWKDQEVGGHAQERTRDATSAWCSQGAEQEAQMPDLDHMLVGKQPRFVSEETDTRVRIRGRHRSENPQVRAVRD